MQNYELCSSEHCGHSISPHIMETLAGLMCSGGRRPVSERSFMFEGFSSRADALPFASRHTIKDIALKHSRRFFLPLAFSIAAALVAIPTYAQKHTTEATKDAVEENHIEK